MYNYYSAFRRKCKVKLTFDQKMNVIIFASSAILAVMVGRHLI